LSRQEDWFSQANTLIISGPGGALQLQVPLVDVSNIFASVNSVNRIDSARSTYNRAAQSLTRDVVNAYLGMIFAQQNVVLFGNQLKNAQARVASLQRRFDVGHVDALALQREQVLAKKVESEYQNALTNEQTATGALGFLISEKAVFKVEPVGAVRADETLSHDVLLKRAQLQREDIKAQALSAKAAKGDHTAQWLGFLPTLQGRGEMTGPQNDPNVNTNSLRAVFSLNLELSLYDGGMRYGLLRTTKAQSRIEDLKLAALERGLMLEIQGALTDIDRKKKLLDSSEAVLVLTQKVFKSAENLFASGKTTSLDLITAQTDLYQAESDVVAKRFDLDLARVTLAFVLGDDIRSVVGPRNVVSQ
jgi:outer membrane protein TolC